MSAIPIGEPGGSPTARGGLAPFAAGFRPFFLLASAAAAMAIPIWIAGLVGLIAFDPPVGLMRWHGHEMLFGVATAALAGFLLTAAPNWTGTPPLTGIPLILLAGLWLLGRVGLAGLLPPAWAAVADVAFLPALALAVGPAILRRSGARNGVLVLAILTLAAANAAFHADAATFDAGVALRLTAGLLVVLIAVIGGRIVPAFTQSGLRAAGRPLAIAPSPILDRLAIGALLAAVLLDAAGAPSTWCAGAAGLAAMTHAMRLLRWQGWRAADLPLVWVLHAGYLWLPVGAALLAVGHLGSTVGTAPLHGWGAGAIGVMLIAVMSRASLGHSGRDLVADAATTAAFVLVFLGATLRVAGALAGSDHAQALMLAGGGAWSLGYALFTLRYLPIWLGRRADGRPG